MSKYKSIEIHTTDDYIFMFKGRYLHENANWHYYEDSDGVMYHFRKEHMVCVIEKGIKNGI